MYKDRIRTARLMVYDERQYKAKYRAEGYPMKNGPDQFAELPGSGKKLEIGAMSNNIFEKLSIIYGPDVVLNAIKNGPDQLTELMKADGKSYAEIEEIVNIINVNGMITDLNADLSESRRVIASFTNATAELDDIILTKYQNLDRSNPEEYEDVMSKIGQMSKFTNSDSPIHEALKNEYPAFKEQQDEKVIDNSSKTDLKVRENIIRRLYYSGDRQDIKNLQIQQDSEGNYLVSGNDKIYVFEPGIEFSNSKIRFAHEAQGYTISEYKSIIEKEKVGGPGYYNDAYYAQMQDEIDISTILKSRTDEKKYRDNIDYFISISKLDEGASIYFDDNGFSIKNGDDISRYNQSYDGSNFVQSELSELSAARNLVTLQYVNERENEQINESDFVQEELSNGEDSVILQDVDNEIANNQSNEIMQDEPSDGENPVTLQNVDDMENEQTNKSLKERISGFFNKTKNSLQSLFNKPKVAGLLGDGSEKTQSAEDYQNTQDIESPLTEQRRRFKEDLQKRC